MRVVRDCREVARRRSRRSNMRTEFRVVMCGGGIAEFGPYLAAREALV
jgi:hypothetical protein